MERKDELSWRNDTCEDDAGHHSYSCSCSLRRGMTPYVRYLSRYHVLSYCGAIQESLKSPIASPPAPVLPVAVRAMK